MKEKLKAFVEFELSYAERHIEIDLKACLDRCYGAMMLVTNEILNYESFEAKEICEWWDTEILPKFRNMEKERRCN